MVGKIQPSSNLRCRRTVSALPRSAQRIRLPGRSRNSFHALAIKAQQFCPEDRSGLFSKFRSRDSERSFRARAGKAAYGRAMECSTRHSRGYRRDHVCGPSIWLQLSKSQRHRYLPRPSSMLATARTMGSVSRLPFPPENVLPSAKNPDNAVNWSNFIPISADPFFYYRNDVPYTENYMLSIQRQITRRSIADDELRRKPGASHPGRGFGESRRIHAVPEPEPAE